MPVQFRLRPSASLNSESQAYLWGACIAIGLLLFSRNPYLSAASFVGLLFCIKGFLQALWYQNPGMALLLVGGLGLLLWGNGYRRIIGLGLLGWLVASRWVTRSESRRESLPPITNTLGKKRWASADDFKPGSGSLVWNGQPGAILLGAHLAWQTVWEPGWSYRLLGRRQHVVERHRKELSMLAYAGEGHSLAFGSTRCGKGVNLVIPNAINYTHTLVAIDPKGGEICIRSVYAREQKGQPVAILDPMGFCSIEARKLVSQLRSQPGESFDPNRQAAIAYFETLALRAETYGPGNYRKRFNPLIYCETLRKRGQQDMIVTYVDTLTELLVVPNPSQADTTWVQKSRNLLKDMILYVLYSERLARKRSQYPITLPTVLTVLREVTQGDQMIALFRKECADNPILHRLGVGDSLNPLTVGEKERPTIIGDLLTVHLTFMRSEGVRECLSGNDIDPDSLYTNPQSIYLVFSPDSLDGPLRGLARLWLGALLGIAKLDQSGLAAERPALFLLDEAASLRRMELIETNLATAASYGVKLMLIFQNVGQLKLHYPNRADDTFFANTALHLYMGVSPQDLETAQYVSKICGKTTKRLLEASQGQSVSNGTSGGSSSSYSRDGGYGGGSQHSSSRTVTHDEKLTERFVEVDLLPADEVAQRINETPLLFSPLMSYPVRLTKVPYYTANSRERYPFFLPDHTLAALKL